MVSKGSTARTELINGTPVLLPNKTDEVKTGSEHWYISYNNYDRRIYGSDTTALVIGQMELFLILNGDHREKLQAVIDSNDLKQHPSRLARCLQYFRDHRSMLNSHSDSLI